MFCYRGLFGEKSCSELSYLLKKDRKNSVFFNILTRYFWEGTMKFKKVNQKKIREICSPSVDFMVCFELQIFEEKGV